MKQFIKFTRSILVLSLMLGAPLLVHASCKVPERGPPGPSSPPATFATWFIPGTEGVVVNDNQTIPFDVNEISSGITNASGVFTLSNKGVYQVTVGFAPQQSPTQLEIQLNGMTVSGGIISGPGDSPQVVTVMFNAMAGNPLSVVNKTGGPLFIGSGTSSSPGIYISILQIH